MCIYCGTTRYTKIYENHNGPIPREVNGRSYEIHHIDGNHRNNSPENLTCLTIQEHYDIHYSQGDYGACFLLAQKMSLSPEVISELNKKQNAKRIQNGTHNLLKRKDGSSHATDRVNSGTHPWIKRPDGSSHATDQVRNGTHPFQSKNRTFITDARSRKLFNWKNVHTLETERLTMFDFYTKYKLNQGNISMLTKGKAKSVKGWIIGI